MKIATFNANSIRMRMPIICQWLDENTPDILCIQETKVQDKDFPSAELEKTGYDFVFSGQKKYNGVALLANAEIIDAKFGLDDEPKDESRMITAKVNGVNIINTYVPQGRAMDSENFPYKLKWFERLKKLFDTHYSPCDPVIWVGDLNVAITEIDLHSPDTTWPSVCYCQESIDALNAAIGWGFTDTFRMHCEEPEQYTFWDYRVPNGFKRNMGWRLDYILATEQLAKKCTSCTIDKEPRAKEKPSDHTFLVAEFDI